MKKLMTLLAAGALFLGTQAVVADTTTNTTPPSADSSAQGKHNPERRKQMVALLKALDLTPADLKGLSKEDRQAKIKSAAEKVTTDLKAKKAAGTITPEEQTTLDRIEKFMAHAAHHKAGEADGSPAAAPAQ